MGTEQLKQLIGEIKEEDRGAFSPLTNNPILLALAWPFGGVGGLLMIEQVLSWF